MNRFSEKILALDEFGCLTEPMPKNAARYSFKEIREYLEKNGKEMSEMTHEEFEMFRTDTGRKRCMQ